MNEFEHRTGQEFQALYRLIEELQSQLEALTETVDDNEKELQSLRTDHELLGDDVRVIAGEIRDLTAEVEYVQQEHNL